MWGASILIPQDLDEVNESFTRNTRYLHRDHNPLTKPQLQEALFFYSQAILVIPATTLYRPWPDVNPNILRFISPREAVLGRVAPDEPITQELARLGLSPPFVV